MIGPEADAVKAEAGRLIWLSMTEDRIVHAPYEAHLCCEIEALSQDSVENGSVIEFWGEDDEGSTWRVHLDL